MKCSHAPVTTFNTFRNSIEFEIFGPKEKPTHRKIRTHTHARARTYVKLCSIHMISLGHSIYWLCNFVKNSKDCIFFLLSLSLLLPSWFFSISKWFINNLWHCVSLLYHCSLVIVGISNFVCVCLCVFIFSLLVTWISFNFQF